MKKGKTAFWIIFAIVIVGIVLAIVFVSLLGNKDTKPLAKSLNSYTTGEGFLSKDSERYSKIDNYLTKLSGTLTSENDRNEVKNFQDGYDAYLTIGEFFGNEVCFMQYTNTYKKNKGSVEKKLKEAQKYADNLISKIESNQKTVEGNEFWQKLAWENCREEMKNLLTNSVDAFNVFSEIYAQSVSSKLLNNEFSDAMFLGLKNLSTELKENFASVANSGEKLLNFASMYYTTANSQKILNYAFSQDESQSNKLKDILEKGIESEYYTKFVEQGLV